MAIAIYFNQAMELKNMAIPDFDKCGNIPIGIFYPSLPEFKTHFVENFTTSDTRRDLFKYYINYNLFLSTFRVAYAEWVAGSFTSAKIDPKDVDLVLYIDSIKLIGGHEEHDFWIKFDPKTIFYTYKCHTHLILQYPDGDPRQEHSINRRRYYENLFTKDRSNNPRGLIEFDLLSQDYNTSIRVEGGV